MKKASQDSVSQASVLEQLQRTDLRYWQNLAQRVSDPVTARVIVKLLDADPYLREHRIGVYLAACETVKRSQIRYARWHRYGQAVGVLLRFARKCVERVAGVLTSIKPALAPVSTVAVRKAVAAQLPDDDFPDIPSFPPIVDPFVDKHPLVH
jgi:hypothetical protein